MTLCPDAESSEPPNLSLELRQGEDLLGRVPVELPAPDSRGRVSYMGHLPTESFRAVPYTMRLVGRQGAEVVSEEASFELRPWEPLAAGSGDALAESAP